MKYLMCEDGHFFSLPISRSKVKEDGGSESSLQGQFIFIGKEKDWIVIILTHIVFMIRWVNQDVSVDTALLYTYEQDLTQMTQVMYDHHAAQYDRLQYSKLLNADNMVVFMPFGFRLV